ncbi:MAG: eukaryotic-like serine/threonine-protein kinase [Actinomycetota bacterium]|jgi:serine/threonine-protein kinase|nr:eukaryotic-like serine/threonine-protein kinase [Actinomycetota bacterium]
MPGSVGSDLPGRVLAGRYLLHGAIGTGASGRVYVADDQRLRRRVAVKVLHAALADDTAFLRRFRAEAQLAASLHHSNIVTVYDWGEDDVPFMVLELLEGGSLRSMLDQNTPLTVAQAARVGRDVASALEYAHARDVLHRDVKPANLLFDEHGIVRVADFGLARALAEASWTEPAGGMLGTARYASPEQAMGLQLDARSDLYALALVLVEAVTGRVPFASDTTIGMLTARTQGALRAPEELGPLAAVIDRAGGLNPDDRYPDAGTMRQALADVSDSLPPPGVLTLAGMIDRADPHPTRVAAPVASGLFDQDAAEIMLAPPVKLPDRSDRAQHRRMVPLVVAIVLLATVGLAASAFARVSGATMVTVPGLVGRTQDSATALAKHEGLSIGTVAREASDPAGVVVSQSPPAGSFTSNHRVNLVVSSGPARVAVPAIVNKAWSTVQKQLDAVGFSYGTPPVSVYSDSVPSGSVVSVDPPAGRQVAPDAKLAVVLSKGHAPIGVPDLAGKSFKDASDALRALGLKPVRGKDLYSNTVPATIVVKTLPAFGLDAPYGSVVKIQLSHGPIMATVPSLLNLTLAEAQGRLDKAHLEFRVNGSVRGGEVVVKQSPDAGARVPLETTTVELTFGKQP